MKIIIPIIVFCFSINVFASRPLKSDDAFTLGRKLFQLEIATEIMNQENLNLPITSTYGIFDNTDLLLGFSLCNSSTTNSRINFECLNIGFKQQLVSIYGLDVSTKFQISTEMGNNIFASSSSSIMLITSRSISSFNFHLNFGYAIDNIENGNSNLWFASAACEYLMNDQITIGIDFGITRNPSIYFSNPIGYSLIGISAKIFDSFSLDTGINITYDDKSRVDMFTTGLTIQI